MFAMKDSVAEYKCGPFSFEIRAWDLDAESIADISTHYDLKRRDIRSNISQYKGLSVYRDGVLVLPKSDSSKDWLGVDLRRVSSLGKRLSTSQLIGMFDVSAEYNPELKDTTDREKLVDTEEYKQFSKLCETIILTLENMRNLDKINSPKSSTLNNLLAPLSASRLESKIEMMVKSGSSSADVLEVVQEYTADAEKSYNELNSRLVYYAQTASLGSVAVVILHEIRNGLTPIQRLINRITQQNIQLDNRTRIYFEDSQKSHKRLLDVANSFSPLCRRGLLNERNTCDLLRTIDDSIRLINAKKESKSVEYDIKIKNAVSIAMHSGELQTVLINLLDNACYWLQRSQLSKVICIKDEKIDKKKITITISDNGPGIPKENVEKIFQPGVTSKPNGIGMGLVIASELLSAHDGAISTIVPGSLGGATFSLELPLA